MTTRRRTASGRRIAARSSRRATASRSASRRSAASDGARATSSSSSGFPREGADLRASRSVYSAAPGGPGMHVQPHRARPAPRPARTPVPGAGRRERSPRMRPPPRSPPAARRRARRRKARSTGRDRRPVAADDMSGAASFKRTTAPNCSRTIAFTIPALFIAVSVAWRCAPRRRPISPAGDRLGTRPVHLSSVSYAWRCMSMTGSGGAARSTTASSRLMAPDDSR